MNPALPLIVLIGILGVVIGSFLNVVIYRVPRQESVVSPGSHCPACDTPIKGRHNVPLLSWVALRGRCASCKTSISVRYPLVELGTGVLFLGLALRFGLVVELPAYLYLGAIGVALAMIGFDARLLPDSIVLPSYVISVLLLMPAGAMNDNWWPAERGLIGMVLLLALFFALAIAYPNGLAMGDVKLAGLLGLYLGWLSWGALLVGALGAFLFAGLGGTAAAVTRRSTPSRAVPLGPCLIAASVSSVFVAAPLAAWYASMLTV